MMTIASEFVAILAKHGIRVKVHGDRLRFSPRGALPSDALPILKRHRDAILEYLTASTSTKLDKPAETGSFVDVDSELDRIRVDGELIPDDQLFDPIEFDCGHIADWIDLLGNPRCEKCDPPNHAAMGRAWKIQSSGRTD